MRFLVVIGVDVLITLLANHLSLFTLNFNVVFEVFWVKGQTASLRTGLHLLITAMNMVHGIFVLMNLVTTLVAAFKLKALKLLFCKSVNWSKFHSLIAFAFLWTVFIALCPWIKALLTKKCVTTLALKRVFDHHCADDTGKEVRSLFFLFVLLNHIWQV